jgi:hypothetical protein
VALLASGVRTAVSRYRDENIHFRVRIEKYPLPFLIVAPGVCFSVERTNSHAVIGIQP